MHYFGWRETEYAHSSCNVRGLDCIKELTLWQNTHQQVKAKILERMAEWTEMFSKDPDLGILEQAYVRLKSQSKLTDGLGYPILTFQ